ncbi:MAG TPA: PHP domain-containing protein [Thermomicrobiales bacterium]|nr:PHP domain-containing protein [Thermomicrobiales bacterium]
MAASGFPDTSTTPRRGIDLHNHTTASDGLLSPAALVELASRRGIGVLGVTDHDTLAGLAPAIAAAAPTGVTLVPGVELSTTIPGPEIHILGYFVDPGDASLTSALDRLSSDRVDRIGNVVRLLNEAGYPVRLDDVMAEAHGGSIGRPHVARALIEIGAATDMNDAFARFLRRGTVGWWPRSPFTAEEAVGLLRDYGAVPVLAHPFSTGDPEGVANRLIPAGLRGIEVYYGAYDDEQRRALRRIADTSNLIPTGGSDYHGPAFREGRELGTVDVPGEVWERLSQAWQERRA